MVQVGTITRDDGTKQVTLNGHPLYTYSGDSAAGDVAGQGVGGGWWVVGPDGAKMAGGQSSSGGY
jgi:predicted lipoprotein with Yx(FWY)xxD motif